MGNLLVFLLFILVTAQAKANPDLWGRPVAKISFDSDGHLDIQRFSAEIVQQTGEPLDPEKVRESLKRLYATGRFIELRADAEETAQGVNLVFVSRARYFIGAVRVDGKLGSVEPRLLVNSSRLRLGNSYSATAMEAARKQMAAVMAENGYYQAQVTATAEPNPDTMIEDMSFNIVAGQPARLSKIEFPGAPAFASSKLAKVAGWRAGHPVTASRVERGLYRLHQYYQKHDYLLASVELPKRTYDPKNNTEVLSVKTNSGPQVRLRVRGAKVPKSALRSILPIYREGVIDSELLKEGQRSLEEYLQRSGYYSVSTRVEKQASHNGSVQEITFFVSKGQKEEFGGYAFKGNQKVSVEDLRAALVRSAPDLVHPLRAYSNQRVKDYQKVIEQLYHSRGFAEVKVDPQVEYASVAQEKVLHLTFQITEGPLTTVGHLKVEGINEQRLSAIWSQIVTKPGQPYSAELAQADRDTILSYLANQGYADATVDTSVATTPPPAEHQEDVTYVASLGPQEFVRDIQLIGDDYTRTGLIWRQIGVAPGKPLNQSAVLESQRKLYSLGIFSRVQIAPQDPHSPETQKTLLVDMEEAKRWTAGYGGGIEVQRLGSNQPQGTFKASPRLSLDVSRLNVGGRAQTVTFRGRLSNLDKGAAINYVIPRLQSHQDLTLRINALFDKSLNVLTFAAERAEASISLEKHFSPAAFIEGHYSFRHVLVDTATLQISPAEIPLLSRPARIGTVGGSYVNDHRDDPSDATRGSYSLAAVDVSWSGFGSQANFLRFSGQNSTYYRLGQHFIFARNTRLGVESPYGSPQRINIANPGEPPDIVSSLAIPLPERFFMGGSESHRGFSINQAGPRDPVTGFPVGGNALFFNSLELRMPFMDNKYSIVLFDDAGNVFSTVRKMRLLKFNQGSPTNFDYDSDAIGIGLRYKTPVGPLRFDLGYDLNPPRYQVTQGSLVEVQRLSRYQFFFSVGQSF